MRLEQIEAARQRVNRRLEAATSEQATKLVEEGRQMTGPALVASFAGTDLPAEAMIRQIRHESAVLIQSIVRRGEVGEQVMGLALRELLLGFELGRMFAEEAV